VSIEAHDIGVELAADSGRVMGRLFLPGESYWPSRSRVDVIAERVAALSDDETERRATAIIEDFSHRHHSLAQLLEAHAAHALATIGEELPERTAERIVLGACFTSEYSVEGAALCNPSLAVHPVQDGLAPGEMRVVMSVREIGEGHVSTLGFTSAVVTSDVWRFEDRDMPLASAEITRDESSWSTYHATFDRASTLSQRALLPAMAEEQNGIEDARLVRFTHADGTADYRATYTAYDGERVLPRLFITKDFVTFTSHPLVGSAAINKGVALFPRPINGELLALVRSDGETNGIARSADGEEWHDEKPVFGPQWGWELVQSGNCGSPIETEHGWLVLTHSVGPMRVYSMAAVLLDLDDPYTVLATLEEPVLSSVGTRQNGYVPNVVYSCGGIVHEGTLWIPFGVGDNRIRVASIGVDELIGAMRRV
jgi:predicted GH43/DUF377 family glycosyl hydrolase